MATWYTFRCSHCTYCIEMSGKPDTLMAGETEPVECMNCHEIYDRLTSNPVDLDTQHDNGCPYCNSDSYTDWDYINRPCSKCKNGVISIDDYGLIVLAD